MPGVGEVAGAHRGCEVGVPQGAREETGVHAGVAPRGGGRMAAGRDGHTCGGEAGSVCGGAEGALDTGPTQGGGRRRTVVVSPPGGGQEPGCVPMGLPGGAQQSQRRCGQGDGPVLGARAAVDMALEALAVNSGALQGEGCREPAAHARDGGAGDLLVEGGAAVRKRLTASTRRTAGRRGAVCARRSDRVEPSRVRTC